HRIMLIMVILGLLSWPGLARLTRAQILSEREKEFVIAAKAVGVKEANIIFKHIMPNVITVLIVNVTLSFASSMLTESSLSFIGFGVVEPNPTWGNMLNKAQDSQVIRTFWWQWVFPALALSFSTISINSIGDGLRDAIDPHSNDR
ncbi:MAG: ABC transporter permease, partial [bacterium]